MKGAACGTCCLIWTPPVWQSNFCNVARRERLQSYIRPVCAVTDKPPAGPGWVSAGVGARLLPASWASRLAQDSMQLYQTRGPTALAIIPLIRVTLPLRHPRKVDSYILDKLACANPARLIPRPHGPPGGPERDACHLVGQHAAHHHSVVGAPTVVVNFTRFWSSHGRSPRALRASAQVS